MRIVLTNAHKNPIILDCPWMHAEDEEAFANLSLMESIQFNVGGDPTGDARYVVEVGIDDGGEFFVDVSSDAEESTERIWSYKEVGNG